MPSHCETDIVGKSKHSDCLVHPRPNIQQHGPYNLGHVVIQALEVVAQVRLKNKHIILIKMIVKKIFNMYKFLLPKCKQTAKSKQSKHNSSTYFSNIRQVKKGSPRAKLKKKGSNYYIIMKQTNAHKFCSAD